MVVVGWHFVPVVSSRLKFFTMTTILINVFQTREDRAENRKFSGKNVSIRIYWIIKTYNVDGEKEAIIQVIVGQYQITHLVDFIQTSTMLE